MSRVTNFFLVLLLSISWQEVMASEIRCQNLYQLSDSNHAIQPGVVVPASGDTPRHCEVTGVIDGTIRFEVSMPIEGWQDRMFFLAHGGNAGMIGDTKSLLSKGFSGATTNSGHDYGSTGSEFVKDHKALIDFGFRAVHLSTVTAKRIISKFYGKEVDYAYLRGCSGGGRSALVEALRYPDDYDGIIAGAPALGWVQSIVPWGIAVSRNQNKNPLTAESLGLLAQNSRARCDLLDDLEDGLISNPEACTVDVLSLNDLQCKEGQATGCMTAGQIETASFIYEGLKNEAGDVVYNGIFPGDEDQGDWMMWVTGVPGQEAPIPGLPKTAYESLGVMAQNIAHEDPTFKLEEFDPLRDQAKLARKVAPVEVPPADFAAFHEKGAKLIIFQGWQDVPLRANDTIQFLEEAAALSGGQKVLDEFSRTYMVPNMLHCAAGTGGWLADYNSAMVNWVENGEAPDAIVGKNPGISNWFEAFSLLQGESVEWIDAVEAATAARDPETKSTRLLCPYPRVALYQGSGEIKDAANYTCGPRPESWD